MSTLTKVLIVLLTVFSIFLCGIVVTYVANADNQKELADGLRSRVQAAERRQERAETDLADARAETAREKVKLDEQIAELTTQVKGLQGRLADATRERDQWAQKAASMASTAETTTAAAQQQTTLFEAERQKVLSLEADQTNRTKELDETNQLLYEKVAVIQQLQEQVRRLTEQNQDVEARLNQYLQQYGRTALRPQTTVAPRGPVQPVPPMSMGTPTTPTRPIALSGQVTEVDNRNRLAAISIGAAAGVRQDMKFHIIRGDRVVADMLILDVEPDRAVGEIQLVQQGQEPRIGDRVSTNL